jgi:hypothetical protein
MSEDQHVKQEPQFAAFVGIDWADQKHVWCLRSVDSEKRESGELEHTPEAVEAWVAQLCQRFGNRLFAVAPGAVASGRGRGASRKTNPSAMERSSTELRFASFLAP